MKPYYTVEEVYDPTTLNVTFKTYRVYKGIKTLVVDHKDDQKTITLERKVSGSKEEPAYAKDGADFSIADVQKILGCGNGSAYNNTFHGEYRLNGRRMIRREKFLYRREMGLDVCVK